MLASKEFKFCAAHHLPNYKGLCCKEHGHNYKLIVTVKAMRLNKGGMVIDFKRIKEVVEPIIRLFDHQNLNNVIFDGVRLELPTAENMILLSWRLIRAKIQNLYKLTLYETDDSYIEYWGEFSDTGKSKH